MGLGFTEAPWHAVENGTEGVDREAGIVQVRGVTPEVQGGELEEPIAVVGDHGCDGGRGELPPELVQGGGFVAVRTAARTAARSFAGNAAGSAARTAGSVSSRIRGTAQIRGAGAVSGGAGRARWSRGAR